MNFRMRRNENIIKNPTAGITLIALVITIIVLLILAGISIATLTGENGILTRTNDAKENTIKGQEREQIKLAYLNLQTELNINGSNITAEKIETELKKYDENVSVEEIEESEIEDIEIVINNDNKTGYAKIIYEETGHIYRVQLQINNEQFLFAGTLTARLENSLGEEYDLVNSPWIGKSIYINKVDGNDIGSGHKQTTYSVEKDGEVIYSDIDEKITLTDTGTYVITVKTENNEGITAQNIYTIKIDKTAPTVGTIRVYEEVSEEWTEVYADDSGVFHPIEEATAT